MYRFPFAFMALSVAALFALSCDDTTDTGSPVPFTLEPAYTFPDEGLADDDFIIGFDFAPDGTLWAITFQGVILRSADGAVTAFHVEEFAGTGARTRDLFIDPQGRPWVTWIAGLAPGGVAAVYDAGEWHVEGPDDLMGVAPKGWAVAVNPAGDVLVGVGDNAMGGVFLRPAGSAAWQLLTPENSGLASRLVNEIGVGPDGSFWVAGGEGTTGGGLTRILEGTVVTTYDVDDGLLYDHIDDVAFGDGRIWLAYYALLYDESGPDGGIQAMSLEDGSLATWFPHTTNRVSSRVRAMTWSSTGLLWFVTGLDHHPVACPECFSGVGYVDPEGSMHVVSYRDTDLAPNELLPEIREGPDGEIYVALAERRQIARVIR